MAGVVTRGSEGVAGLGLLVPRAGPGWADAQNATGTVPVDPSRFLVSMEVSISSQVSLDLVR